MGFTKFVIEKAQFFLHFKKQHQLQTNAGRSGIIRKTPSYISNHESN